jgi:DUF4097 and DUF4098 domain-containing protein YvlB
MRRIGWSSGAVLAVIAAASAVGAEEIDRHFHEGFDVKEGARLHLNHGDGDVAFEVWDRDVVDIEVTYRATIKQGGIGTKDQVDFAVEFTQQDDEIRVVGHESRVHAVMIGFVSKNVHEYVYAVKGPAWLEVRTEGQDGAVSIEGLAGTADLELQDGDLSLTDCALDRARVRMQDGDFDAVRCSGDLDIRTQDGRVRLRDHGAGPLTVRAQDGDVRLELVAGASPELDVRVADGDVTVGLADGVSTEFLLLTDDGRVRVDLVDVKNLEKSGPGTYGEIGGGEGTIRIESKDGSITLRDVG